MKKFSIIITSYNRITLLKRAITSVLSQTYPHFELLVIDDGSKADHRLDLHFCSLNKIKYVCHKKNRGVSEARNTGIKQAENEYIVFLDDDDELHNIYLEELEKHLAKYPNVDFVWSGFRKRKYKDGKLIKQTDYIHQANSFVIKETFPMLTYWGFGIGLMIKKNVFDKIGLLDSQMTSAEDIDFLLRMIEHNMQFISIPKVLVDINEDTAIKSLARNSSSLDEAKNLKRMIQNHNDFLKRHPRIFTYYMKSLIFSLYRSGDIKEAREQIKQLLPYPMRLMGLLPRSIKYETSSIMQNAIAIKINK